MSANLTKTDTRLCLFRVATVREKSGENEHFSRSGKIFDIVRVSEKSGNSVFLFIVHKFSSRF